MTTLREAAQQALEALVIAEAALADIGDADREPGDDLAWCEARAAQALKAPRTAITALRSALEQPERAQAMRDAGYTRRPTLREMAEPKQPEQEPVAWEQIGLPSGRTTAAKGWLFSEPPRREWRGLTEGEINDGREQLPTEDLCNWSFRKGVEFAEAALKEKNL